MRRASEQVYQLLGPVVCGLGYELVGIEYSPGSKAGLLRLYIDRPEGVTLDDCQLVSHQVSGVLDVADPISGRYALEVSSPGMDRPLFEPGQFERYAGSQVRVRTRGAVQGRKRFKGRLVGCADGCVTLEIEGGEVRVPLGEIESARLIPEF